MSGSGLDNGVTTLVASPLPVNCLASCNGSIVTLESPNRRVRGKPNLLDMGSLMIKPIQRVMKYPLLLCELRNSTPACHPDFRVLEDAFAAVRDINVNINELKRRKDLVLKYKKNDEDESLKDKLSKLNIHSISKKSKRVTNHLKILTRGESQVIFLLEPHTFSWAPQMLIAVFRMPRVKEIAPCCSSLSLSSGAWHGVSFDTILAVVLPPGSRPRRENVIRTGLNKGRPGIQTLATSWHVTDNTFNREEKLFRSLEKAVRHCVKNISLYLQHIQDATTLALQSAMALQEISCNKDEEERGHSEAPSDAPNPCGDFAARLQTLVLTPLSALLALFPGPRRLVQKRYDKLLDCGSPPRRAGAEADLATREYEALNAQLGEELRLFNRAARGLLADCLRSLASLLGAPTRAAPRLHPAARPIPPLASNISEIQNRVLEELQNLNFVKDNSATFIERKLSFEKKKPVQILPETPRQTDTHRLKLLSTYSTEELYQAKRRCNATQEYDINLLEGELVAVMEQKDPLGSTSRWLVDTGLMKGYVYSSFLKPYNPAKVQKADAEHRFCDDDFDNISLFVSARPAHDSVTGTPEGSISDSSSSLSGTCGKLETNGTDADSFQEVDEQIFYAVHAFQARSDHELSLQEYQRVHILRFCDLSGNAEWWLAEAQGQKGYVPANYLGKMTYA
ncbi:hypothetical protein HPG69_016273 [Diceros bicornis minor]|uniref:Rho guanine nucleotide exchange factor 38 n=1 Tax=Diceros bicornis minor TaxID=77932 RepID=A0A7J7F7Y5_DICBM|nr:hypothetical protein HPG69_016273 [Diceros bicornis minor]